MLSAGPAHTDVSSGAGGIANPGYGSYNLPPDPGLLAKIVASDPGVQAAQLALNTGTDQGNAGVRQLASSTAIDWGDPSIASDLGQAVDPHTADAAAANTAAGHSQLALLNLANQHALDAMYTHLATLGGGQPSGELGFEKGLQSAADSLARYQGYQKEMQPLQDAITKNANTQQGLRDAVTNAVTAAKANGNLPGPTHVTVGSVPGAAAPHLGGSTGLAPGTYTNAAGSGTPNYQLTPKSSLAPGTYQNAAGGGLPSYKPINFGGSSLAPGSYSNLAGAAAPNYGPPVGNMSYR
jgi:hypothetical protein